MTRPKLSEIDLELTGALAEERPLSEIVDLIISASGQVAPPVDLSKIVGLWAGLKVTVDDLDGEGYMIQLGGRSGEIFVRRSTMLPRRRFTVAHELGHWVLALSPEAISEMTRSQVEQWCDEFARELLIPRPWLQASLELLESRSLASVVSGLPAAFQVSPKPMWIQCSHHGFLSIVVAGRRVEEYASRGALPVERAALVRATLEYRDRETTRPAPLSIGNKTGMVFRSSRAVAMGLLHDTHGKASGAHGPKD